MLNNLIIMATYWNERDFIEPSLAQIDALNPAEILICDGCFDPRYPNTSTDGTREVIEAYVASRPHARMISATRAGRFGSLRQLLRGHQHAAWWRLFTPGRLKSAVLWATSHPYRVNQALTFQHMISLSTTWQPGMWVMTMDSDQFYTDEMIANIIAKINTDSAQNLGYLTGKELTFLDNFQTFTDQYEKRNFNNMPHKIYAGTTVVPTRSWVIDDFSKASFSPKRPLYNETYLAKTASHDVGLYHHYKFRPQQADRLDQSYQVGDRKQPDFNQYATQPFTGKHPRVIQQALAKAK